MKTFYVYIHRKADSGDVFYVGKGSGNRVYKIKSRSEWWRRIYEKHGRTWEIVAHFNNECDAFDLEKNLIKKYREEGFELCNFTDGGEGMRGFKANETTKQKLSAINKAKTKLPQFTFAGRKHSDATKKIISEKLKASAQSKTPEFYKERNAAHRGWKMKDEQKEMLRQGRKGKNLTEETKRKISSALTGKEKNFSPDSMKRIKMAQAKKIMIIENGKLFDGVRDAARWLKNNGRPSASNGNISASARGEIKKAYGFTWAYV